MHAGLRIVHHGLPSVLVAVLESSTIGSFHSVDGERTEFFLQLAVYVKACLGVVAGYRNAHLLALGHLIVELVEIALACKSQLALFGVGNIECGVVRLKQHCTLSSAAPSMLKSTR